MIAIEGTIVSTAMPQIAAQLGDLHLYAWAFSAFLLSQTATTVTFGKLADLYGRKPVLLGGIAIFLVGSLLCGFAWVDAEPDLVSADPGAWRRGDPAGWVHHRRRSLHAAGARADPGGGWPASGASPRCAGRWSAGRSSCT